MEEKNVSFQWLRPHSLAFLRDATKLCIFSNHKNDKFCDLLKGLEDLASDCVFYGESIHYKKFKEVTLSFMPELGEFFVVQRLQQLSDIDSTPNTDELLAILIGFLVETIGELLNCGMDSNILVSNQVKFLLKKLESILAFIADTPMQLNEKELNNNIMAEIESVANEAGFFLHSFFFTAELVTKTYMDLTLTALVERIETVQMKIKDHCIVVPKQPDC
ncbi:Hypothetical predicted protein [Olea europaea subsp. europaea]|uniref:Uncharacterized protein n=1 Tax=Olea europaea subsp. europaea TaxID=158383 RepID=A0A8S0QA22_OLEEU|nr:Hypothetical predicted protein [Olea europaea subsp. europaea]